MKTRLIAVRHGQTDWNPIHRIQGLTDTELNQTGIRQMEEVAEKLKTEKIDIIYTSTLKRGYHSAEIVNRYHTAPIVKDPDLGELSQGEWQGKLVRDLEKESADYRRWQKHPLEITPPGGENIGVFAKKVIDKITKVLQTHNGKTICLVSHEVTNAVLRCNFRGYPLPEIWRHSPSNKEIDLYEFPSP
jgi:probable phosphoglycerate mutase